MNFDTWRNAYLLLRRPIAMPKLVTFSNDDSIPVLEVRYDEHKKIITDLEDGNS